jgi:nucleoside-diphosphate-sugar epimerase
VARALLVGCGCRGRELGARLLADGWQVRGTTRHRAHTEAIEGAGVEPALADPERVGTVLDWIEDVSVVAWLLGSARGEPEALTAIHGSRLERLLQELVDTPVRGFVYETPRPMSAYLEEGRRVVGEASERWRIPVEVVAHDPADWSGWAEAAAAACGRLIGAGGRAGY